MEKIKTTLKERINTFGVKLEEYTDVILPDEATVSKRVGELGRIRSSLRGDLEKIRKIDERYDGEYESLIEGCFKRLAVRLRSWDQGNFQEQKGNMKLVTNTALSFCREFDESREQEFRAILSGKIDTVNR